MSTYDAADAAMMKNYHAEVGESLALGLKTYYSTPGFPAKAMGDLRGQNIIALAIKDAEEHNAYIESCGYPHRTQVSLPQWVKDWHLADWEREHGPIPTF